jgi:3-hydroxybutyrate dehydrogenase
VAPIHRFPDDDWARLRNVMLDGPFVALKAAWHALTARRGSRVVITASVSSYLGAPLKVGYVSAKHGVLGLMRVAALEAAPHGLTVNAVAPGWMDTGMLRGQLAAQAAIRGLSEDEIVESLRADQPGKRFIDVHEAAAAVGFLASPRASGVNGVCLPVDLGASING